MSMDPNKRGNPPFEPSSFAVGLQRRVDRHKLWSATARNMARALLDGTPDEQRAGEAWWRDQLNQPEIVTSLGLEDHP